MIQQIALAFGERYRERSRRCRETSGGIGFTRDAFPEQPKMREESQRTIYLNNLTAALYHFYGGDITKIAALETPEDSYEERDGKTVKKREHYPDPPAVSNETCRTLAEMILDENQYSEALDILRGHDKSRVLIKMNEFLRPYVPQMDNLELRRVHGSYLEKRVA